uniref:cytochrome P450 2U1-like n=1 Tax=Styela clava TaxID=7725 RepID=UPI0019397724|nr:cytochrome P450 2U1-like [Styela clava]
MMLSIQDIDYPTYFIGISTFLICYYLFKRPKNFPPGPRGLPLLGYVPFLGSNTAESLRQLKEKYGSVMSIQFGREYWVILNDFNAINEALVKQGHKFSGRPVNFVFDLITKEHGFLSMDYGPTWKALQKFGLMKLRGFGVGRKGMEEHIIEETPYLIESLTKAKDCTSQMKLTFAVSNIMCRVVLGSRFEYDDKKFLHMIEIIQRFSEDSTHTHLLASLTLAPILRFIPPFRNAVKITSDEADCFMKYLREFVEEHKSNFDQNNIRDFIDAFLLEIKKSPKDDSVFNKFQLIQFIRDLLDAGSVTVSSTLAWALLALATFPECQEKISQEISETLGEDGLPSMKHRDDMPYTCAFIQELMRHRTVVPMSIFRKTNEEAILNGYTIPKNTTITPNLWAVHFDSDHFENPQEFLPERFIDRDGKFIKSNHVIPFSIGQRGCIGQQLAKMEVFIFLTGIVQKLKVIPDPERPLPSFYIGGNSVATYEPPKFEVIFERR